MTALHKAALIRAYRTFLQTVLSLIPAGLTVNFVNGVDWVMIGLIVLGMICTSLIAGVISFLQSVIGGLPEADLDGDYDEMVKAEINNSLIMDEIEVEE